MHPRQCRTKPKIQVLSQEIEEISRVTESEIARAGISPELIKQTILGTKSQLPPDIKNLLEKSQFIKNQLIFFSIFCSFFNSNFYHFALI